MTEKELIRGCIQQDPGCQHMLFDKYAGILMTICRRYARERQEAEDILQEAFIRIFSYIGQYRFEGAFEGWLKKITVNAALRILRNKKIHFSEIGAEEQHVFAMESDVVGNLGEEELLELIAKLPDGYRIVFNLYILEGYDHREIAQMLHIKEASSRSQLSKAKTLLKRQINSIQKMANKP